MTTPLERIRDYLDDSVLPLDIVRDIAALCDIAEAAQEAEAELDILRAIVDEIGVVMPGSAYLTDAGVEAFYAWRQAQIDRAPWSVARDNELLPQKCTDDE